MDGAEAALDGGQTVTTVDDLVGDVSEAVAGRMSGMFDGLSQRMDALEAGLDAVAGSAAGRLQVEGLAERLDTVQAAQASLSAQVEEATLQAGEEIGPVIGEEIGPVIVQLIGNLLDFVDSDGDGASDVEALVEEIRANVADISVTLVHPAMTTNFADYTVTEALLLLGLMAWFVSQWIKILGSGFYWMK